MVELPRYRTPVADSARWWGFEFRADDIVICTPPKCGTTWMQTICALLLVGDECLDGRISGYSPWLDMVTASRRDLVEMLDAQQHRRFIKTHTPLDGLPTAPGVTFVCVGRDPRDVHFSWAGHLANMDLQAIAVAALAAGEQPPLVPPSQPFYDPVETFESWVSGADDDAAWYIPLTRIVAQLRGFWDRRDDPQLALFHYRDLLYDLEGEVRRLAGILGLVVDDERCRQVAQHAAFAAMKSRAGSAAPNTDKSIWRDNSAFFRSGTTGQWRDVLPADLLRRYDERIAELVEPDLAAWMQQGRAAGCGVR
jgi:aryl sulfotransferase